jgi:hypothetical protein
LTSGGLLMVVLWLVLVWLRLGRGLVVYGMDVVVEWRLVKCKVPKTEMLETHAN